jgi:hypothetical protein
MRTANLVVATLGLLSVAIAATCAWRWRNLSLTVGPAPEGPFGKRLVDAARALGAVTTAGVMSGILVLGLGGRLVMRLLAATSGAGAQGRLTEADEVVGAITTDGTIFFVLFVGLGGGYVVALGYALLRSFLPNHAGRAGLVVGVLVVGSLGVADPLSPDNVDFTVLAPVPLAVLLLVALAILFATSFTALAARLDRASRSAVPRPRRVASCAALPLGLLVPPFAIVLLTYIVGRATVATRLAEAGPTRRLARGVALALLVAAVSLTAASTVWATARIVA